MEKEIKTSSTEIIWIGEHFTPAVKHWFIIPSSLCSDDLVMIARDVMGQSLQERIVLPAIGKLAVLVNDRKSPEISTIKVIGVYQDIMLPARIGWVTDEESRSEVR